MTRPNLAEPTARAVYIAQELANLPTQTDRMMRIHAEMLRYEKHPEQAVVFSVALNLAVLSMLDNTIALAGQTATYNPRQAALNVKRSMRRRKR